jgi:hypothetical protein
MLHWYGGRKFLIGNMRGLLRVVTQSAGRRRCTLLIFHNYGLDTSAFRPVMSTSI